MNSFRQRNFHSTSMPVIRTGIDLYSHMPITITEPVLTSLSHMVRGCLASLSHLANDRPMHYWFVTSWPGGSSLGQSSPQAIWPAAHLGLPFCQISSLCINPCWRYPLQKILQTDWQTVNDTSPACLSACGDNKIAVKFHLNLTSCRWGEHQTHIHANLQ